MYIKFFKGNFEKVYIDNRYYNMDKESSFSKLEEVKDKTIQVNNRDTIVIKNIESTDMYTINRDNLKLKLTLS